jgi:hypothetical protein
VIFCQTNSVITHLQTAKPTVVEEVSEGGIGANRDVTSVCNGHPRHSHSIVGGCDLKTFRLFTGSIHVELATHAGVDIMTANSCIPDLLVLRAGELDVAKLPARRA